MVKRVLNNFLRLWNKKTAYALKQEAMLHIALCEAGIKPGSQRISVDHINGRSNVSGIEVGLVFPKIFFDYAEALYCAGEKTITYYFDGYQGDDDGRKTMLKPFTILDDAVIVFSRTGREQQSKGRFNVEYYRQISESKFVLCPHQKDWPYSDSVIWTYRFVEACMAGAIPVVFNETPLSREFTQGIQFVSDKEALSGVEYDIDVVRCNMLVARERFTLSDENVSRICRSNIRSLTSS